MRALFLSFLFLAGCQSCAGPANDAFKACAKTVTRQAALPAALSAAQCGQDKDCLRDVAEYQAQDLADRLLKCAQAGADAGND